MSKAPSRPPELTRGPFRRADAESRGLSVDQLRGTNWRRLFRDVWASSALPDGPWLRAAAASLVLPESAVFAGRTAAALWGADISPSNEVRAIVPPGSSVRSRPGLAVTASPLEEPDVVELAGLRVTSELRTAFDLARVPPVAQAVADVDVLLSVTGATTAELSRYLERFSRWPGLAVARQVAALCDPRAESPRESLLRVTLVQGGLPMPLSQVNVYGPDGFAGRVDLLIDWVAIEYDGLQHELTLAQDHQRRHRLMACGLTVLSYTAGPLLRTPGLVVAEVRAALEASRDPSPAVAAMRRQTKLIQAPGPSPLAIAR